MKILVTGGRGFIGLAAAKELRRRGHDVTLLSSTSSSTVDGFRVVQGDVREQTSLLPATEGIEAVVISHQFPGFPVEQAEQHNTFREVDAEGTRNVLAALKQNGNLQRVVYLSGAAVNDTAPPHPGITAKLDAERYVTGSGVSYVILRASIVYGPGDHYFSRLAGQIRSMPVVPTFGDGRAKAQPIHVDDLALTIAAALEEQAGSHLLDVCGPNTVSTNQTIKLLSLIITGQQKRILHLPVLAIKSLASVMAATNKNPPLSPGLIDFSLFDNTSHGTNADKVYDVRFRDLRQGLREVYGNAGQ